MAYGLLHDYSTQHQCQDTTPNHATALITNFCKKNRGVSVHQPKGCINRPAYSPQLPKH